MEPARRRFSFRWGGARTAPTIISVRSSILATFAQLGLAEPLVQALTECGYTEPTPIQEQAIPPILAGRDLLGCAQTGTGKTAAFALPVLQHLGKTWRENRPGVRVLVLTPTRELATQIDESFARYGVSVPFRRLVIFGGVGQAPQVSGLRRGAEVVVACPGRLLDLIGQGHVDLSRVEILVVDEADRMLDMGFIHEVKRILRLMPPKRQNLLFSATMPPAIAQLAGELLHKPAKVEVTPPATTVERIDQSVMFVQRAHKRELLAELLKRPEVSQAIVFTRTKHGANRLVEQCRERGVQAEAIHGNKSQSARTRALQAFREGSLPVLVATDVASRGLDIEGVSHVINYDLPMEHESYVHRIGRTGRAGRAGVAVSLCEPEEAGQLKAIERLIRRSLTIDRGHRWHIEAASGASPAPAAAPSGGQRPSAGRRGGGNQGRSRNGR